MSPLILVYISLYYSLRRNVGPRSPEGVKCGDPPPSAPVLQVLLAQQSVGTVHQEQAHDDNRTRDAVLKCNAELNRGNRKCCRIRLPNSKKMNVKPALVSLLSDAEVFPQSLLPRHGCADGPVPLDA